MNKIRSTLLVLLIFPLLLLAACGNNNQATKVVVFADAGWESIRFHNEVARLILEKGYGYRTDVTTGSTVATILGLRQGDIDVYMEMWANNNKKPYEEGLKAGDIQKVGVNFDDNRQGLYVPTYLIKGDPKRGIKPLAPDLKSVSDLAKYKHLFKDPRDPAKGRIIGPPTGWEVYKIIEQKLKTYGLQDSLNFFAPGSDTALTTSLTDAYEKGEAWVGYYWEPTWVIGKYDMTLLEEPAFDQKKWDQDKGTAFPKDEVAIVLNKNTAKESPEIVAFLKKYRTNSELTNEALAYMQDKKAKPEEVAKWWMKKHMDIWTKWVPKDVADKVKQAL